MLTDAHCKNARCSPDSKRERFADSGGLYLEVSPTGSKRWFWKYRRVVLYVLGRKQASYSQDAIDRATNGRFKFDTAKDILDYRDVWS